MKWPYLVAVRQGQGTGYGSCCASNYPGGGCLARAKFVTAAR
jgi:hypothetical protein